MKPKDKARAELIEANLIAHDRKTRELLGIKDDDARSCLVMQLLDSVHRVDYVKVIRMRNLSERRADPNDPIFDPLCAAILHQRNGDLDEAFWLVFLFVHFGKHPQAGWRYLKEVYGRFGDDDYWTWERTSNDTNGFRRWLDDHIGRLTRAGIPRGFGNHRKFQSLDAYSATGTGSAVESYVNWIGPPRSHDEFFDLFVSNASNDPQKAFDDLYNSMSVVASFGRLAKFDYLTMIGKLNLAPIEPGSTYMSNSTGPASGGRLLFAGKTAAPISVTKLDRWLSNLAQDLDLGMQVIEDALCNWQKSPRVYKRFRG